jgi:hypothetical protein
VAALSGEDFGRGIMAAAPGIGDQLFERLLSLGADRV